MLTSTSSRSVLSCTQRANVATESRLVSSIAWVSGVVGQVRVEVSTRHPSSPSEEAIASPSEPAPTGDHCDPVVGHRPPSCDRAFTAAKNCRICGPIRASSTYGAPEADPST